MGKASRRKAQQNKAKAPKDPSTLPPAYAARPFAGLPGETEWVAMREIVPAATAPVSFSHDGTSGEATVATVLPLAWAGLHRDSGEVMVGLQSGGGTGDLSRDLAEALLAAAALEAGQPLEHAPKATAASPRLQDLIADSAEPLRAQVHEGFEFWVDADQLDAEGQASLDRANEAAAPTVRVVEDQSAFWCRIGDRTYVRWVLPHDENRATDALARLHAADRSRLGDGRLLGAFRACGLLVPVWEVEPDVDPADLAAPMADMVQRFDEAHADESPLTPEERRARNGFVSRQVTLR